MERTGSELVLYNRPRGRPRGPNYEANKAKTDRKMARKLEREKSGIPPEQQPAKRQRTAPPVTQPDTELSKAAKQLIKKVDALASQYNWTATLLLLPNDETELPRFYTTNGRLKENFEAFESVRNSMQREDLPKLLASSAAHMVGQMEPLKSLIFRQSEENFAQFTLPFPDDFGFELPAAVSTADEDGSQTPLEAEPITLPNLCGGNPVTISITEEIQITRTTFMFTAAPYIR